jgi:hypothetical protein
MNEGALRLWHGLALTFIMSIDWKDTKVTSWLVERIGIACMCVLFFFIWISSIRRKKVGNRRQSELRYPVRKYLLEATVVVRVLFLMSMASILRLK